MAGCAHHDVKQFFFVGLRRHQLREPQLLRPTGNAAFNEWRTTELARLDEERRKLDEAQREFSEYVDAIRRAKDREEFDRFMAERRALPPAARARTKRRFFVDAILDRVGCGQRPPPRPQ